MVTTVTTITTIAALGIGAVISAVSIIALIVFLTTRELAGNSVSSSSLRVARYASVGILPLVLAFAVIVVVKVFEIL
jgi:hypothetical protein